MPTGGVSVPEMEAVEALLGLRFDRDSPPNGERPSRVQPAFRNEMESTDTAALSMNRCIGVKIEPNTDARAPKVFTLENGNGFIIRRNPESGSQYKHLKPPKKRSSFRKKEKEQRRWPEVFSAGNASWPSTPNLQRNNGTKDIETSEKSTQTEIEYQIPQIRKMESVITELCAKIRSLESQLHAGQYSQVGTLLDPGTAQENTRKSYDRKAKSNDSMASRLEFESSSEDGSEDSDYIAESETKESFAEELLNTEYDYEERQYNHKWDQRSNLNDMVPIGDGHATVPSRLIRQLDWSSYTNVTRKLLSAVFSRRVLATHSLTGKRSPAFPDKPAKKKLDPALLNDIIQTVVERCSVPENVVRTIITTKCADESKMLRTRLKNKKRQTAKKENIPPRTSTSSTDSSASRL